MSYILLLTCTLKACEQRLVSARDHHLEDRLDRSVVVVTEPRQRAYLQDVETPVRADHLILDVHKHDPSDYDVQAPLGALPASRTVWW